MIQVCPKTGTILKKKDILSQLERNEEEGGLPGNRRRLFQRSSTAMKKDSKVQLKTSKTSLNQKPGKFSGFNQNQEDYGYNLETEHQGILDTE